MKGKPKTEEWKRFMSKKMKGRVFSPETRKKMSESGKMKRLTEEHKQKIRNTLLKNPPMLGKHLSLVSRRKISESHKGKSSHMKGKHLSEETKRRISESRKGRFTGKNHPLFGTHRDESVKNKISEKLTGHIPWNKGIPMSESTKQKLRYARSKIIMPYSDTKPERMLQIALKLNGINFEKHKLITDHNGFYHQVDIFIKPNICIEVDGNYWHTLPRVMKRDLVINHKLMIMGYFVIRLWESDIKIDANKTSSQILKFIHQLSFGLINY